MKSKKPKILHSDRGYSISALAARLQADRRTIANITRALKPIRVKGSVRFFDLAAVEAALDRRRGRRVLLDQRMAEQVRKLKIDNDRKQSEYVSVEAIQKAFRSTIPAVKEILERKLLGEYAEAVANLDASQCRQFGKRILDEILVEFEALKHFWEI